MLTPRVAELLRSLRVLREKNEQELSDLEKEILQELEFIDANGLSDKAFETTAIGTMIPRPPPYIRVKREN